MTGEIYAPLAAVALQRQFFAYSQFAERLREGSCFSRAKRISLKDQGECPADPSPLDTCIESWAPRGWVTGYGFGGSIAATRTLMVAHTAAGAFWLPSDIRSPTIWISDSSTTSAHFACRTISMKRPTPRRTPSAAIRRGAATATTSCSSVAAVFQTTASSVPSTWKTRTTRSARRRKANERRPGSLLRRVWTQYPVGKTPTSDRTSACSIWSSSKTPARRLGRETSISASMVRPSTASGRC